MATCRRFVTLLIVILMFAFSVPVVRADMPTTDAKITALEVQMVKSHSGPFEAAYLVDPDTGDVTATLPHAAKPSEGIIADLANFNYNDEGFVLLHLYAGGLDAHDVWQASILNERFVDAVYKANGHIYRSRLERVSDEGWIDMSEQINVFYQSWKWWASTHPKDVQYTLVRIS